MYSNFQVEVSSCLQEKQDRRPRLSYLLHGSSGDYQMALVLKNPSQLMPSLLLLPNLKAQNMNTYVMIEKRTSQCGAKLGEGSFSSSLNWAQLGDFPNERSLSAFRWKNCQFNKIYHTGLWRALWAWTCAHTSRIYTHVKTNENKFHLLQRKTLEMNSNTGISISTVHRGEKSW